MMTCHMLHYLLWNEGQSTWDLKIDVWDLFVGQSFDAVIPLRSDQFESKAEN